VPCFAFRNGRINNATPSKSYLQSLPVAGPPVLVLVAVHEAVQQGCLGAPKSLDLLPCRRAQLLLHDLMGLCCVLDRRRGCCWTSTTWRLVCGACTCAWFIIEWDKCAFGVGQKEGGRRSLSLEAGASWELKPPLLSCLGQSNIRTPTPHTGSSSRVSNRSLCAPQQQPWRTTIW